MLSWARTEAPGGVADDLSNARRLLTSGSQVRSDSRIDRLVYRAREGARLAPTRSRIQARCATGQGRRHKSFSHSGFRWRSSLVSRASGYEEGSDRGAFPNSSNTRSRGHGASR